MGEDGRAVALDMLVEPDARASLGHDRRKRGFTDLKRITPQVVAVQLDQVEGVQKRSVIVVAIANEIEGGDAVIITGDRFPIDNAGARAQASQRLDDQRKAVGEVVARTTI